MSAFFYSVRLQCKLDIRSKSLLVTCYVVPLLFFAVMGIIFTSILPESVNTLIQSMIVMGVSMGAVIGLPPSLVEIYGSDIKKVYQANGVSLSWGMISMFLSAFIHLSIMSVIIFITAPLFFGAVVPQNILGFFSALAIFIFTSLCVGCVLGLLVKNQGKLTMISQLVFLPSIMVSGIMFPVDMLPKPLQYLGNIFPATWGFRLMSEEGFSVENIIPMLITAVLALVVCVGLMARKSDN